MSTLRTFDLELRPLDRAQREGLRRVRNQVEALSSLWREALAPLGWLNLAESVRDEGVARARTMLESAREGIEALPEPFRSSLRGAVLSQYRALTAGMSAARGEGWTWAVFAPGTWSLSPGPEDTLRLHLPLLGRDLPVRARLPRDMDLETFQRLTEGARWLEARIGRRQGRWLLRLRCRLAPRTPLGVDLGLLHRAVVADADGRLLLDASGRRERGKVARMDRVVASMQRKGAHRAARRLEARRNRYQANCDLAVAGAVVRASAKAPQPVLHLEDEATFANLPEAARRRLVRTSRAIRRSAGKAGVPVRLVDGRQTTHRCETCGTLVPASRQTLVSCRCGTHPRDLKASRNLARLTPVRVRPAGEAPRPDSGRQAVGTAASRPPARYKGEQGRQGREAQAPHAWMKTIPSLGAPARRQKENTLMTTIVKDLGETTQKLVVHTLDNLKTYVDKTSQELGGVNLVGATRNVLDTAIDGAKNVVKAAETLSDDPFAAIKVVADRSVEATREVLNTIAEEGRKADLVGVSTRIAMEGLNTLRSEVDYSLETGKALVNRLQVSATPTQPVVTRPPQVTRVEIEHEKPARSSAKSTEKATTAEKPANA
ncbi:MAG: zinc ribbon domain-containing protein [Candidatus Sericytochromatia bacterium]|nr:zinc ribbon domain-containing protein [Candidatus Sericytochromatia bacterium]